MNNLTLVVPYAPNCVFYLGSGVQIVGNREGSDAKFKEMAINPSQFTSIETKTATSLNICASHCRYVQCKIRDFFLLSMKGGSQISRINVGVINHCLLFKCCIVMLSYLVITGHITHIST